MNSKHDSPTSGSRKSASGGHEALPASDQPVQLDPQQLARITDQITEHVLDTLKSQGVTLPQTPSVLPLKGQPSNTPLYQPVPTSVRPAAPISPTSPVSSHQATSTKFTPPPSSHGDISDHDSRTSDPQARSQDGRSRRDSGSSMSGPEDGPTTRRPRPLRIPSTVNETSIERAWRPLFDKGKPTPRLGQFLRGIAKHIIDEYQPLNSMTITPGKLATFFQVTGLNVEMLPWYFIFGGQKVTNTSISKIFRELRCEHHLVQRTNQDLPTIPGLTPHGFETFLTLLILAYPDQEFQRLNKVVQTMPINNADMPSERLPKELSRRLLPSAADALQQQRLVAAIATDPTIPLNSNVVPPPPPTTGSRRRALSKSFATTVIDDDDAPPVAAFAERERKPYAVARESSSMTREDLRPHTMEDKTTGATNTTKPSRASTTGPSQPSYSTSSRPIDVSATNYRPHRSSMQGPPINTRQGTSPSRWPMSASVPRTEGYDNPPTGYYPNSAAPDDSVPRRVPRRQNTDDDAFREPRSYRRGSPSPRPDYQRTNLPSRGHGQSDDYMSSSQTR